MSRMDEKTSLYAEVKEVGIDGKNPFAAKQQKELLESSQFQRALVESLVTPDVMEAFRKFQDSDVMRQIRMVSESPALKVMQRFNESFTKYQRVLRAIPEITLPPDTIKSIRAVRDLAQSLERMQSPLVEYLSSVRTADLGRLVEASGAAHASAVASADATVITHQEVALERAIVERLEQGESPETLPQEQRNYFKWILSLFLAWLIYLGHQNAIREELCFFQPKVAPWLTASQTGKAVRKILCEADLPTAMLQGFRLVDGVGVRLREGPSMKSAVIPITLRDKSVVQVLDSSNRDWLYVSVIGEEGVEGWISRKYTYRLIR